MATSDENDPIVGLQIDTALRIMRSIGPFIIEFSKAELMLYKVLLQHSGVTDAVGRAIFSGVRVIVMIDFLRAIAVNTKMGADRFADLQEIFQQFSHINFVRNLLIHQRIPGFTVDGTTLSNQERATKYENIESYPLTFKMMQAMTNDLSTISLRLSHHAQAGEFRQLPDYLLSAWQYKSVQPVSKSGKSRAAVPKPRRQRPSSPR